MLVAQSCLTVTPWTAAHQAPLSLRFSRQGYWSGLPFPSPGDLPNPGIEPGSPALQANSLPTELQGKLDMYILNCLKFQEAINACICKFWTDVEKLGKNYLSTKKTFYSKMIAWEKHFCKWKNRRSYPLCRIKSSRGICCKTNRILWQQRKWYISIM